MYNMHKRAQGWGKEGRPSQGGDEGKSSQLGLRAKGGHANPVEAEPNGERPSQLGGWEMTRPKMRPQPARWGNRKGVRDAGRGGATYN